jgi:hypothetical protein
VAAGVLPVVVLAFLMGVLTVRKARGKGMWYVELVEDIVASLVGGIIRGLAW